MEQLEHRFTAGHCRWRLAASRWEGYAARAAAIVEGATEEPGCRMLKEGRNRLIFRLEAPGLPAVVVKAFPFTRLKQKLWRHSRYAPQEARHLQEAARRGIPVPRLHGWGEVKQWGVVQANLVLMEGLDHHATLVELLPAVGLLPLLDRVGGLLLQLYHGGCNHIDVHLQSFWLGRERVEEDRIIDFQYARFLDRSSVRLLVFQSAYFCRSLPPGVLDGATRSRWLNGLLHQVGAGDPSRWEEEFERYLPGGLSIDQRLRIE